MIKEISRAKKSIFIEMYILLEDTSDSHDFFGVLKKKLAEGVKVVLIADAYGSYRLKKKTIQDLREAGAEFLFFSHWFRRTHRKIIIIDNQTAFIGGVNVEKKIANWTDISMKIKSRRIIKSILRSFIYTYQMCGGKDKALLKSYRPSLYKKIKRRFLENLPGHGLFHLVDYYQKKIISAQKSLKIVTPYFIPPKWLLALFDDAIRRGVEIEIIIPKKSDLPILDKINAYYIKRVINLGVKFYAFPKMIHAKMLIVDNEESLIGSQNVDLLSLGRNYEAGVFTRQKNVVKDLKKIFDKWKKRSKIYVYKDIKINLFNRLTISIFKLFFYFI